MRGVIILGDPGAVSRVRKNDGESFQERAREPLRFFSWKTSSTTHSNGHFWLGIIGSSRRPASIALLRDLLIPNSLPKNSTVRRTCLPRTGKLSLRRVPCENGYRFSRPNWPLTRGSPRMGVAGVEHEIRDKEGTRGRSFVERVG